MAKLGNKHTKQFEKCKIHVLGQSFEVALDFSDIGKRLDIAQYALDQQVWEDVQHYMPFAEGGLIEETSRLNQSVAEAGEVYCTPFFDQHPYAHYVYEGEVYVDPDYGKGAFYDPDYGFWSRPGVTKVPSGRQMVYSKPSAVSHWADVAVANHTDRWVEVVKRAFQ